MRRQMVAGNWKMHGSRAENAALVEAVLAGLASQRTTVVLCPPLPGAAAAYDAADTADALLDHPAADGVRVLSPYVDQPPAGDDARTRRAPHGSNRRRRRRDSSCSTGSRRRPARCRRWG